MDVREKVRILPGEPGVYRFLDSSGRIIYIGKAKNLKKRVSQYFQPPERLNVKTRVLVSKIADLEHTVVESEEDAFLLENNLIKQYKPKYNILLKDDKTYPWICLKREPFPRVFITRRLVRDGSAWYGPYSSTLHAKNLVDLIHSIYPLRTCKYSLTPENIASGKIRPCLNMHIKKCMAPCAGLISAEEYNSMIEDVERILKGKTGELMRSVKAKMKSAAANLEFEEAQRYKEQYQSLENHYSKSLIVSPEVRDLDLFSILFEGSFAFGNFLRVNDGCITSSLNMEFKLAIEEPEEEVLGRFIMEIYQIVEPNREIVVPFMPSLPLADKNIHVPLRGDKLSLLELSKKNAAAFKFQRLKQEEMKDPEAESSGMRMVNALQKALNLKELPVHIECFDNSNIQGTNPVGACVVFKRGKPSKRDYRIFNIKSVVGPNDYATMYEVITRRYSRLVAEGEPLPQLILVDGGRGQITYAHAALQDLNLADKIELAGLAERLEEIILPGDPVSYFMDKNSPALKLLMQLRDEAHRFGITRHRDRRSKEQTLSRLSQVPGVGPAREEKLIREFKSLKRILDLPYEKLADFIGNKVADAIWTHFGKKGNFN